MSKRTTIVLAGIAAALLAFILIFEQGSLTSSELDERRGRLLAAFVRPRVTELEIKRGDQRVALRRERQEEEELGEWKMTSPVESAVDQDAVDALLGSLEWADARRTLTDVSDEDLSQFGLDTPRIEAWFTAGRQRVRIRLGADDPQATGLYARVDDERTAFVVGRDLFEALDHDAAHFRSKQPLVGESPTRATRLELTSGLDERVLEKREGRWWLAQPVEGLASTPSVQEILRALEDLRVTRFVSDRAGDLAEYGLEDPSAIAVLVRQVEGADRRTTVLVGAPCEDQEGEVHVRIDDGPVACTASAILELLSRNAGSLREQRLIASQDEDVEGIRIARGTRSAEVRREEERWRLGRGDDALDADEEAVADFLRALRAARATEIVDASDALERAHGLSAPSATITLERMDGTAPEVVHLGATGADESWVRRGTEPVLLRLPGDLSPLFEPALRRFRDRQVVRETADEATAFVVKRGAVEEEVTQEDGRWKVRRPVVFDADAPAVRTLRIAFASLRVERFVADRPVPEHGLAEPRFVIRATFTTPEGGAQDADDESPERPAVRSYTLEIGAATEGGAFGKLGDGQAVFVVPQAMVDAVAPFLLARELSSYQAHDVEAVTIERGSDRVRLRQREGAFEDESGRVADNGRTDSLLDALTTLRASETLGYGAAPAEAALDAPRARVTVTLAEETTPRDRTVLIGAARGQGDDAAVYARLEGIDATFLVPAASVEPILEYHP